MELRYTLATTALVLGICAAAQPTDFCPGQTILVVLPSQCASSATAGNNSIAGWDLLVPSCDETSNGLSNVWYNFNSGTNTSVNITLTPGSGMTDHAFAVYQGLCDAEVACFIGPSGPQSIPTQPGTEYYVKVYSNLDFGDGGAFTICVSGAAAALANDACEFAQLLNVLTPANCATQFTQGNNAQAAITTAPVPSCDNSTMGFKDVWYRFSAGSNTQVGITLTPSGSMTDWGFAVYGFCGGSNVWGCETVPSATIPITIVPGMDYWIQVFSNLQFGNGGPFTICVSALNAPANDNCSGATQLTAGTGCNYQTFNTLGATDGIIGPDCPLGNNNDDVWFRFTAPGPNVTVRVDGNGSAPLGFDPVVQVLFSSGGNCSTLTAFDCVDATGEGGIEEVPMEGITPGGVYYVRVYDADDDVPNPSTFGICVFQGLTTSITGNVEDGSELRISPMPAREFATIQGLKGFQRIEVFDMTGRSVLRVSTTGDRYALDVARWTPGTYLLRADGDRGSRVMRMVVE